MTRITTVWPQLAQYDQVIADLERAGTRQTMLIARQLRLRIDTTEAESMLASLMATLR